MNRDQLRIPKALIVSCGLFLSLILAPLPAASAEGDVAQMDQFLALMQNYLGVSEHWVEMASRESTAIYLAIEGIVEIYEQRGDKAKAIPHLKRVLEKNDDNQTVRNAIRFKLRDLYKETGQMTEALEELDRVIDENSD